MITFIKVLMMLCVVLGHVRVKDWRLLGSVQTPVQR